MNDQPWYVEFFGPDYLRHYLPLLPPELTELETEGLVYLLDLPPGSRILDLCCGHGRHSIALAQRGYQVTGLDLSQFFLDKARADAEAQGVTVHWVHSDMRHIPFTEEFDAVVNLFSAFGYLESEEEDQKVLHQVHQALKPGGKFLIEMVHRDALMRRFSPRDWTLYRDGLIVLEDRRFDLLTGRNEVQVIMIEPDGRRREYHHAMRIYSLTELVRLLEAAALKVQATYGELDGRELTLDSRRLVVMAVKES